MAEICQMLTLSTGHLSEDTCNRWLSDNAGPAYPKGEYGWFVFTKWGETDEPMPVELAACFEFASGCGCDWVMFDCDAPMVEQLPTFDW